MQKQRNKNSYKKNPKKIQAKDICLSCQNFERNSNMWFGERQRFRN